MRIKEIELSAAKGQPLPTHMTAPEMCLYTSLRALYKSYHKQEISKESAQIEKKKIIAECEQYDMQYNAWIAAAKYYQENIRRAGTLLSDVEKSTDIYIMMSKAAEAIGCMTGDEGFPKRIANKIKEMSK